MFWGNVSLEIQNCLFGKYSWPYVVIKDPSFIYFKKIIEKLGVNRKKWLFSKTFLYSVTNIPGPPLVPDPSFIRFWYVFQTLRLFATLCLLGR